MSDNRLDRIEKLLDRAIIAGAKQFRNLYALEREGRRRLQEMQVDMDERIGALIDSQEALIEAQREFSRDTSLRIDALVRAQQETERLLQRFLDYGWNGGAK